MLFNILYTFALRASGNGTYRKLSRRTTGIFRDIVTGLSCNASRICMSVPIFTTQSRVLVYKLTVLQLVKKSPILYGNWRCIILFTRAHHLTLYWATWITWIQLKSYFFKLILILSLNLFLGL